MSHSLLVSLQAAAIRGTDSFRGASRYSFQVFRKAVFGDLQVVLALQPIQNPAEFPKTRAKSNAVSSVTEGWQ